MTMAPPPAVDEAGPARRFAERRRRRLAVAIGVLSVPLAVAAAGYLTWSADDGTTTPPPVTGTTLPAAEGTPSTALVPDGDYGPLCDEVRLAGDPGSPPQLDAVYRLVLDADLSSWVDAAPAGFRPTLRRLEVDRAAAQTAVGSAPDIATLDQATKDRLPPTFATDLLALSLMLATECPPP